jgi:hypothetical protein
MAPEREEVVGSADVVPRRARRDKIRHLCHILPPDLGEDPTFTLDSDMWDDFGAIEWDTRRC